MDRYGPRKPLLAAVVLLMVPLYAALWGVMPGGPVGTAGLLLILIGTGLLFALTEVLHNALLVPAAGTRAAEASGLALALGNLVSVGLLVALLWGFALPGTVDWPFVPSAPLFGVDQATHEPDRLTGPIVAASLGTGLLLILLFVPDMRRTGLSLAQALAGAPRDLWAMARRLGEVREATIFLVARMLYADGKAAILLFGGVLAAGVMGWGTRAMLAYGILLSILAVLGGLLAPRLDRALGPRNAVLVEIGATVLLFVLLLLTAPGRLAGVPVATAPLFDGPFFTTPAEIGFIALGGLSAIAITAAYASSRTLMTRLVPPERLGTFFGFYALSGTATAWLGPLLVAFGTLRFGSQQGGLAMALLLLVAGFLLLLKVRPAGRPRP